MSPAKLPQVALSLSCEPFSPQLTQFDSSSWSQAIVINATSFPFLSGFQTRAQAPASSHQPLSWCQQSSSKPGTGPSVLAPMVQGLALPGLDGTGASPPTSKVCSWTLRKSGVKASLHLVAASLSSSTVSWPGQRTLDNLWVCWPCSPSFIRVVSSSRCFKLSTQREDLCHTGGLSQWSHLCSPLFSTFSFFPPIFRDSAMNKKRHLIEGFI